MQDVIDHLIADATVTIDTETDPALLRPVELPVLQGSRDAITADTGWQPSISLQQSLADVMAYARHENQNSAERTT